MPIITRYQIEVPDEFEKKIREGDPRCELKVGDTVEKVFLDEGDLLPLGAQGTITGSWWDEEWGAMYLILYGGMTQEMCHVAKRVKKIAQ